MKNIIEKIKTYEKYFCANHYNGNDIASFKIEEGSIPVMLSASHAVNHYRNGNIMLADMYTGGLTKYLYESTGCHIIYASTFSETDANFDPWEKNLYQQAFAEYVKTHDIKFLIDLHGAGMKWNFAVELGTVPCMGDDGKLIQDDASLCGHPEIAKYVSSIFSNAFCELLGH